MKYIIKNAVIAVIMAAIIFICGYALYIGGSVSTASTAEGGVRLPVIMYHNISEKQRLWGTYNNEV